MPDDGSVESFAEVGELLQTFASALQVVLQGYGPPWASGSPAEADTGLDEGLAGEPGQTPMQTAALLVGPLLGHAQDHLQAAARLAGEPNVLMACFTLCRPILESTSRAMYLLDPLINSHERLRRSLNLRFRGLDELNRLTADRKSDRYPQAAAGFEQQIQDIERLARACGFRPVRGKRRDDGTVPAPVVGQRLPGDMEIVSSMLNVDGMDVSDLVYRVSSAFVHGQTHFMSLLSIRRDPIAIAPYVSGVEMGMRLDNFVVFMASAAIAVHRTALAALAYAGLPASVWQDLAQPVMRRWQASIHAASATAFRDMVERSP